MVQGKQECHYTNGSRRVRYLDREIWNQEQFIHFDSDEGRWVADRAGRALCQVLEQPEGRTGVQTGLSEHILPTRLPGDHTLFSGQNRCVPGDWGSVWWS